jgi:putative sigma-54 modulation protein
MRLRMAARGVELSVELADYVRRRVHFSLGRFSGKIKSLYIRLADVNGPRGGTDKLCDIQVNIGLRRPVIVCERQVSIHSAVAFALERAERAVQRQFKLTERGGSKLADNQRHKQAPSKQREPDVVTLDRRS